MQKELEILFNSKARPKILKVFFQYEEQFLSTKEIADKSRLPQKTVKKEVKNLKKIRALRMKTQKRKHFYKLNPNFPFINEIRSIIFRAFPLYLRDLTSLFKREKRFKLVVVAGLFFQESRSPADLLIVGDRLQGLKISRLIRKIESEVGKEMRWSLMTTDEFEYRIKMHDRFLRDILDHAHKKIINKLKI